MSNQNEGTPQDQENVEDTLEDLEPDTTQADKVKGGAGDGELNYPMKD